MEASALSHVANGVLVVATVKWLRGTKRYQRFAAWMPCANAYVHRTASFIGACLSAVGIDYSVHGTIATGLVLGLVIPPLWVLAHTAWDVTVQMALNQLTFWIGVQEKAAAPVMTVPVAQEVTVTAPIPKKDTV